MNDDNTWIAMYLFIYVGIFFWLLLCLSSGILVSAQLFI